MALELAHGPFELGGVIVHGGSLWHVESPGATGDDAWSLLSTVSELRAHVRALAAGSLPAKSISTADAGLDDGALDAGTSAAIESARLERVVPIGGPSKSPRGDARISQLSLPPAPIPAGPADSSTVLDDASQQAYEELFRAGTQAYLRHDFPRALEAFTTCARLRPNDKRVQHNIERLKSRMRPEGS